MSIVEIFGNYTQPEDINGEEDNSSYHVEQNKFCCNHWLPFHSWCFGSVILSAAKDLVILCRPANGRTFQNDIRKQGFRIETN